MHFNDVPVELIEHIFSLVDPEDLAALNAVNAATHALIEGPDKHLWRIVFLRLFDHPKHALGQLANELPNRAGLDSDSFVYNWRQGLKRRIRASKVMPVFLRVSSQERADALRTLTDIVLSATPYTSDTPMSLNTEFVQALLDRYPLPSYEMWRPESHEELECKAWLRACGPKPPDLPDYLNTDFDRRSARALIYDLRSHSEEDTHWGPFTRTKNIAWLYVDSVMQICLHNVKEHMDSAEMYPPQGYNSCRRFSSVDFDKRREHDWAGVEGVWTRLVCFCDYNDLVAYNSTSEGGLLDPSLFRDQTFREALRGIRVEMKVIKTSQNDENAKFPILHVIGRSSQIGGTETYGRLEGTVRMTRQGVVLWSFVTNVGSSPQWSSEAIQVGGVGSAIGVAGLWTGREHQDDDPVGPFMLFKTSGPETSLDKTEGFTNT